MLLVIQATATTVDEGYGSGGMQFWGEVELFFSYLKKHPRKSSNLRSKKPPWDVTAMS